jgi:hypothetical protein
MFSRLACLILAGGFCLASLSVCAHEAATEEASPFLDCDNPPEHALRVIPQPIARWSRIECTPAGQMLVQSEDWIWRYPGSFTDRPFLPAWMTADPNVSPEPRYFKALAVRQAAVDEARALTQRLARGMIELPAATESNSQPERIYVVVAESNLGERLEVNFVYRSDQDIWAVPCVPDCRPEQVFHIYRRE